VGDGDGADGVDSRCYVELLKAPEPNMARRYTSAEMDLDFA